MIKGLYAAASAMLLNLDRQKTLAHNSANLETIGFKEIFSSANDFEQTSVVFSPGNITGSRLTRIGNIGLGAQYGEEMTNFDSGGLKSTGNMFDLAINGNGFFRIQTAAGERYTRDGRFIRDANNQLVTSEGNKVLDSNGQPITLPVDADISIAPDGTISTSTQQIGKLGVVVFDNPGQDLERTGDNLYNATGTPNPTAVYDIQQGFLEMSNVNVSRLMTDMILVENAYNAAQKMVTTQDSLLGMSISTLGRMG
jgi:flagellar basal-body rod protein FlgF